MDHESTHTHQPADSDNPELALSLYAQIDKDALAVLGPQHGIIQDFATTVYQSCYNHFAQQCDSPIETLEKLAKLMPSFNRIIKSYIDLKNLEMAAANFKRKQDEQTKGPSSAKKGLSEESINELSLRLHSS